MKKIIKYDVSKGTTRSATSTSALKQTVTVNNTQEAAHAAEADHAKNADSATNAQYANNAGRAAVAESLDASAFSDIDDRYISKTDPDTAEGKVTFKDGIGIGTKYGITSDGIATLAGALLQYVAANNWSISEEGVANLQGLVSGEGIFENLTVTGRMKIFQLVIDEIKSAGGSLMQTAADGFVIDFIEANQLATSDKWGTELPTRRLWWKKTDGTRTRHNMWQVGDQALCYTNNLDDGSGNLKNKLYWAVVVGVGEGTCFEENGKINVYKALSFGADTLSSDDGTLATDEASTLSEGTYYDCNYIDICVSSGTAEWQTSDSTTETMVWFIGNSSDIAIGDSVVMLGHRACYADQNAQGGYNWQDIKQRGSAIYLAAYASIDTALVAPLLAFYGGINNFAFTPFRETYIASGTTGNIPRNRFIGSLAVEGGDGVIRNVLNWRGEWNANSTYYNNDEVTYGGQTYYLVLTTTSGISGASTAPGKDARWHVKVSKGSDGQGLEMKASADECTKVGDCYIDENGHLQYCTDPTSSPKKFSDKGMVKGADGAPAVVAVITPNIEQLWDDIRASEVNGAYQWTEQILLEVDYTFAIVEGSTVYPVYDDDDFDTHPANGVDVQAAIYDESDNELWSSSSIPMNDALPGNYKLYADNLAVDRPAYAKVIMSCVYKGQNYSSTRIIPMTLSGGGIVAGVDGMSSLWHNHKETTDATISTMKTEISANSTKISTKVSQTDYDSRNKTVDEHFSQVEQNASEIKASVKGNSETIAKISDGEITLQAGKTKIIGTNGTETLIEGGKIQAEYVEAQSVEANTLATIPSESGIRIVINQGMMLVYGTAGIANIRFGVNEQGMSVLSYYNNDGEKLYDLGPDGVSKIDTSPERLRSFTAYYLVDGALSHNTYAFDDAQKAWNDAGKRKSLYQYFARYTKLENGTVAWSPGQYCESAAVAKNINSLYLNSFKGYKGYTETNTTAGIGSVLLTGTYVTGKTDVPAGSYAFSESTDGEAERTDETITGTKRYNAYTMYEITEFSYGKVTNKYYVDNKTEMN